MKIIKAAPITLILIVLNTIVFAINYFSIGTFKEPQWTIGLLEAGALFNPYTLDDEWYRILSHMFMHGGILHLIVNMYALYSLGTDVESYAGTKKFIFIYFISGIGATITTLSISIFTVGVGASGAIFGIYGFALISNITRSREDGTPLTPLFINFAIFVGINLLIAKSVHADNAAHFGGLITGLIIGSFSFFTHSSYKRIVVDLVLLTIFIGVFFSLSRYQVKYFNFYQSLFNTEEQFNEQSRGKHTDPEFLSIYKNTRADWDTTLSLLDSITYFPKRLEIDTARIREYIRLAKKVVDFRTIMLEHESFIYLDSIQYASQQMQDLPRPKYVPYFRLPKEKPDDPPSEEASKPVKVLYDSNWAEIPNPPAVYYRIAFKDSLDNWHGAVTDYYANGDIQMKGRYDHGKRDGVFIYYSDHKTYTSAGRYRNNFYYRKWEIFHDNGLLKSEIFYTDSYFLKNLWDIIGVQLVKDGNGTEVQTYSNGVIAITGDYHGGRKEGYWHGKHENGKMFFEENFYQGRLVRGRSFNNQGEIFNYDESSLFPIPEGGFQKFRKYLKDEASKITSKQDGMVRLSFQVTLTGEITDILIEKSASPELDAIAKQIVLNGPKWIPGKIHGQLGIEGQAYAELNFENYPNN